MSSIVARARLRCAIGLAIGLFALSGIGVCGANVGASLYLLHDPSINGNQIVFSYAGDLWMTTRTGMQLRRLTGEGNDSSPVLSPDGAQIAFAREANGVRAVYVMSATGGTPRRLTYHPADLGSASVPNVIRWSADSRTILFNSRREAFVWQTTQLVTSRLFTVLVTGGPVTSLPLPSAVQAALSPDGSRLAYVPVSQWQSNWKHYRGGQTTPIWVASLADSRIEDIVPRDNSNDFNPMWVGQSIYFLSDRDGPTTLYEFSLQTKHVRRVLPNSDRDIETASATSDAIVYEQLGSLSILDLKSGRSKRLDIRPTLNLPEAQPHVETIDASKIEFANIAPAGDRVVFGARGELLLVSIDGGGVREVAHKPAVVQRDPAWSSDGRFIACFSDEAGEYALHIIDADRAEVARKLDLGRPPGYFYSPTWSPDSRRIAYTDQRLNYWYVDLDGGTPVHIDNDVYVDSAHQLQMAWSPDSRWLAYTRQLPSHFHAVFLYSIERARTYQVTDGRSDALHIAFDRTGHYLIFTASTDVAFATSSIDMSGLMHPVTRAVYEVPLARASTYTSLDHIDVETDHIGQRIVALPIPPRNYYHLTVGSDNALYLIEGPPVDPVQPVHSAGFVGAETRVLRFEPKSGETKELLENVDAFNRHLAYVSSFHLASQAKRMLYRSEGQWLIASLDYEHPQVSGSAAAQPLLKQGISVEVDPRAEWRHMFFQVWRDERDFFYDPGLHGVDLDSAEKRYEPYLQNIQRRRDLTELFRHMLGAFGVGHMSLSDTGAGTTKVRTALLGADFVADQGKYRIARIYHGDVWDPAVRAPLAAPDVGINEGDYLLAVNGAPIQANEDVYRFFTGVPPDEPVTLTVGPDPAGTQARTATVRPIEDETSLRLAAWIEGNRQTVDRASGGRIAYIYIPDTYDRGYPAFNRQFFAQVGKEAAIIDARFNTGGVVADYILDALHRPLLNYWYTRYGQTLTSPQEAIFGSKVLLINELTGSGGDQLAWQFRKLGLGPIVGRRTWGGLIGAYTSPDDLLDGGGLPTPNLAFFTPAGSWEIENHGVSPDVEVEQDPHAAQEGHDPQLEKAIAIVSEDLAHNPPPRPERPPYPVVSSANTH